MKDKFDKRHVSIAVLVFLTTCSIILFYEFSDKAIVIIDTVLTIVVEAFLVLKPLFWGLFIALLINPILKYIETKILDKALKKLPKKARRFIGLITSYLIVILFIYILLISIMPDVLISISKIVLEIPIYLTALKEGTESYLHSEAYQNILVTYQEISDLLARYNIDFEKKLTDTATNFANNLIENAGYLPNVADIVFTNAINTTVVIVQSLIALVLSFYLLADKEHFLAKFNSITKALFGESKSDFLIDILHTANYEFEAFFIAKIIDSLIIGFLFYLIASIFGFEFVGLSACIIAVTNMIPYFGPFIGAIPIVLLAFTQGTIPAVWMGVIVLVLQQFDGLVLGPKILGESNGLKPITIIIAIMIGGSIAGPIGMFLAVPLFAVVIKVVVRVFEKRKEIREDGTNDLQI